MLVVFNKKNGARENDNLQSGKFMMKSSQRYTLELDAHSMDDEFERIILNNYDVKIIDRSGEPWSVIFEGTREQLQAMVLNFWGESMEVNDSDFSPVVQ